MGSILIGIKKFITNKNTITIIAILGSLFLLYWAYNKRISVATQPVAVPYAISEIGPNTEITNDMISTKKVPGGIVGDCVVKNVSDIVGKYVSNDAVIPAGSVFYICENTKSETKSTIKSWENLKHSVYADIPDGNTIVALPVSLESTYGNSIFPGNYIDLYYQDTNVDGKLMLQKFIESIKVLAVTDANGDNIFETNTVLNEPAYLIFSVSEDMHLLLRKASYLSGTIFPVPRNKEYSNNPKPTKIVCSYIKDYILEQTVDVKSKDNGNISINTNNGSIDADIVGGDE